jgi:hypothetical protein
LFDNWVLSAWSKLGCKSLCPSVKKAGVVVVVLKLL